MAIDTRKLIDKLRKFNLKMKKSKDIMRKLVD